VKICLKKENFHFIGVTFVFTHKHNQLSTLLLILYIVLFFWILKRWKFFSDSGITTTQLWLLFSVKLIIGFGLTWIYTAYYTNRLEADIFKYFDDSEVLYNSLFSDPTDFFKMLFGYKNDNEYFFNTYYVEMNNWDHVYKSSTYNDARTIIRLNAIIRLFSLGNIHIHTLFFTALSMIGFTGIFRSFKDFFSNKKGALIIAVFLIPSVIFWSSGALKESILIFGMGILIYALKQLTEQRINIKLLTLFILSFNLLFLIKFYVLLALLPCVMGYFITIKFQIKYPFIIYSSVVVVLSVFAFNSRGIPPHFDFVEILITKQKDFIRLALITEPGSRFELTKLEPTFFRIAQAVPEAIANCFIRPLITKGNRLVFLPSIIENTLILALIILSFFSGLKRKVKLTVETKNIFWFSVFFTLILFTIIGLTTPVSGALVRYKIPALPFLGMAILTFLNIDYLSEKIPFLKFLK